MASTTITSANVSASGATGGGFLGIGHSLDRCQDGTLVSLLHNSTSNNLDFWYSKDQGATWTKTTTGSIAAGYANERRSMFIDEDDQIHVVFKQNTTTGGRTANVMYYMLGVPNAGRTDWTFGNTLDVTGAALTTPILPDIVAHRNVSGGGWAAHISYNVGAATLYYTRVAVTAGGVASLAVTAASVMTGAAVTSAGIDFNHTGNGKTVAASNPTVWFASMTETTTLKVAQATYSAGAWTLQAAATVQTTHDFTSGSMYWLRSFWDGTRFVCVGTLKQIASALPDLMVWERDAANATTTARTLAASLADGGYLAGGTATYDNAGNIHFTGITSTAAPTSLVSRLWTRATTTLAAATAVATITSASWAGQPFTSVRRGQGAFGRIDFQYTDQATTPIAKYDKILNNSAPTAPTGLNPTGGVTLDRTIPQQHSWTFADPDLGNTQASAILQYRLVGAGAWTQVTVGVAPNYTFSANALAAGDYEWQVQTTDNNGAVSPFSASSFFTMATPPATPTITAPTSGGTVSNTELTTWTAAAQDAYQIRTVADTAGVPDTATVYTDSGTIIDTPGRSRTLSFAVNGRYEHIQIRVRSGTLWSAWASIRVLVSFSPPATPVLTVTPDSLGNIAVTVVNPAPTGGQPVVVSWDVYRKVGASGTGFRIAKNLTGDWTDRSPANGVDYRYLVRAVGSTGVTGDSAWST